MGAESNSADSFQPLERDDHKTKRNDMISSSRDESSDLGEKESDEQTALKHRTPGYRRVWFIFLFFGLTTLLPWNAYITPWDFYGAFYFPYDGNFSYYMSCAYNAPSVLMLVVMMFWGERWPLTFRIVTSLGIFLLAMLLTPFVHTFFGIEEGVKPESSVGLANEAITIILILLCGVANGILFPTIIQMGTQLGPMFGQSMMEGNGVAGLVTIVLRVVTKLAVDSVQVGTEIYFFCAAAIVVIAFFMYIALFHLDYSKTILTEFRKNLRQGKLSNEKSSLLADESMVSNGTEPPREEASVQAGGIVDDSSSSSSTGEEESEIQQSSDKEGNLTLMELFKKIWVPGVGVLLVFWITLSLFPNVTAEADSEGTMDDDWWDILTTGIFMVFDWVGRSLPKWSIFAVPGVKIMFWVTVLRLLFFPLWILPALQIINEPWYPCLIMVIFALSNGYASSLLMMKGPFLLNDEANRGRAGTIMTFLLNCGLTLGTFTGLGIGFLLPHEDDGGDEVVPVE